MTKGSEIDEEAGDGRPIFVEGGLLVTHRGVDYGSISRLEPPIECEVLTCRWTHHHQKRFTHQGRNGLAAATLLSVASIWATPWGVPLTIALASGWVRAHADINAPNLSLLYWTVVMRFKTAQELSIPRKTLEEAHRIKEGVWRVIHGDDQRARFEATLHRDSVSVINNFYSGETNVGDSYNNFGDAAAIQMGANNSLFARDLLQIRDALRAVANTPTDAGTRELLADLEGEVTAPSPSKARIATIAKQLAEKVRAGATWLNPIVSLLAKIC